VIPLLSAYNLATHDVINIVVEFNGGISCGFYRRLGSFKRTKEGCCLSQEGSFLLN